jgi:methylmalonyl-CoA mutase cobalamin-binding subunit
MSADGSAWGNFEFPESAARALGLAAQRAAWLRRPAGTTPEVSVDVGAGRAVVDAAVDGWLEPDAACTLLEAYGIPLVEARNAETPDEAAAAAIGTGVRVVVKSAVPGAHKTESGGVILDVRTPGAARSAAARMGGPVIVQRYVTEGVELLAGLVQDAVFGPLVAFGPGGVFAELIGSANFALAPLTNVDVAELLDTGKASRLVDGWRGACGEPRRARRPVAPAVTAGGRSPGGRRLDLNPVLAGPAGCVAVDTRVRLPGSRRVRLRKPGESAPSLRR